MTKARDIASATTPNANAALLATFPHRNLIINGAMQVAQRGTSATGVGSTGGYFTCDRWRVSNTTDGRYTLEQSAVTDLAGISSALKFSCTTADTSVAAGDNIILSHRMEGLNTQSLKNSSTSMKSFTLSFYAKSNASRVITSDVLFTNGTNRLAAKAHTIGTSWQRYTMTVPAASSTQLDNDNTNNLQLNFWLHAGSNFTSGTLSTTLGPNVLANRAVGIGSLVASTSNTFEITGVQLEVGDTATPFEHRSYGDELAKCQRYYWQLSQSVHGNYPSWIASAYSTTQMNIQIPFPVTMRSIPTMTYNTGNVNYYRFYRNSANHNFGTVGTDTVTSEHINLYGTATSSHTAGTSGTLQIRLADGAGVFASAEL